MAAPADYWDTVDLKALAAGGLVNEDVMQKIWDISRIPLPFSDRVGTDSAKNSFTEWTEDALKAPDTDNAVVSGSDSSGNDAAGGKRVGNHCQNSVKNLQVTERAQSTDNIGRADELAYQIMMRQQELRRDVEAIAITHQASVADNNDNVAGRAGGFSAWLESNTDNGAGGSDGGFNTTTRVVDAPTPGDRRALTLLMVDNLVESAYLNNGDPSVLMSVPQVIRRLNDFLFTSDRIAKPTANVSGSGSGVNQTAQGYISVFVTHFGTSLTLVPNRLQQVYDSGDTVPVDAADVFLIDPGRVALAYLKGYQTKPLGKLGLSERSQISVDWTVKCYVEKAHGVIRDINPTAAVTAGT
jgi:hypothetical protein